MITYRFTAQESGMFVQTHVDVGWMAHLNCAGDMTSEFTVPYEDDEATVWFGHPYCFTVVGTIKQVGLLYNHSASPISKYYDGDTFVVEIEKQPAMKCEVANVRRN